MGIQFEGWVFFRKWQAARCSIKTKRWMLLREFLSLEGQKFRAGAENKQKAGRKRGLSARFLLAITALSSVNTVNIPEKGYLERWGNAAG